MSMFLKKSERVRSNVGCYLVVTSETFRQNPHPFRTEVLKCNYEGRILDIPTLEIHDYDTREDAVRGHKEMIAKWKGGAR